MEMFDIVELRHRLSTKLKFLIRNPVIESKELAAFDLIMIRRRFLKHSQVAAIGAFVAAGLPPTVWAKHDPDFKVCSGDVDLTDGNQVSTAHHLVWVDQQESPIRASTQYVAVGYGTASVAPPYDELPPYPILWDSAAYGNSSSRFRAGEGAQRSQSPGSGGRL